MIEEQPVFSPAGQYVQTKTYPPEEGLPIVQYLELSGRQEIVLHEFIETRYTKMALGHPADHLDISERARPPFDIGFKLVSRVVVS